MKKMMDTPETRENLIRGGKAILSKYAIGELAANFQALYEKTAVLSFRDGHVSPVSAAV
jgi:hypothetical protein